MKIQIKSPATIVLLLCILFPCCTIRYYDTNKLLNDYKTEGFLDCDHFQVIIKGIPDKKKRGLVFRRESALSDTKSKMNKIITERLVDYNLNYQIKKQKITDTKNILNIAEIKENLAKEFKEYIQYGHIAFEYYNENNSAVIVYRIFKYDLIEDIESIETDFKLKTLKEEK